MSLLIFLAVIAIIALIVFAVCRIRIGLSADYDSGAISLSVKFAWLKYRLLPKTEAAGSEKPHKDVKEPSTPKKKTKKKKEREFHLRLGNDELLAILKKVLNGIGKFRKGIQVDRFILHFVAGGYDPYDTTRIFGFVNSLLCALAPVCANRFSCKELSVSTAIDYNIEEMQCDFGMDVTVRIGRIFAMINTMLLGILGIAIKNRFYWRKLKKKDPEEYEFEIAHPSLATRLLDGLLHKKKQTQQEPGFDNMRIA